MNDTLPMQAIPLFAIPLFYLLAAWIPSLSRLALERRWLLAQASTVLAMGCVLLSLVVLAVSGPAVVPGPTVATLGKLGALTLSVRTDAVGGIVLLLVSFIGWVIVRYSQSYLGGDRGQARYIRALLSTLAAVSLIVVTNNLIMLALAWLAASLTLHQLLTFYNDRPQALIAAHKKFIASRVADLCLFLAVALIGATLGSVEIDQVLVRVQGLVALPFSLQAAAVLIAATALLKCAQLPVHGWLIQVMEAPTPVSALLHAGVVNLGGFVLIRLSALMMDAVAAQTLLVVVGSVTAIVAALVMMTRISIKVMLAWSTCAQMGFMLMQCGLGAYDLALLHLVAHSLYKAHAFLGAGGAVEQARLRQMTPSQPVVGLGTSLIGALAGLFMVTVAGFLWGIHPGQQPALYALAGIVCLALTPLLTVEALRIGGLWPLTLLLGAFGVAFAYFGLHQWFSLWVALPDTGHGAGAGLVGWVLLCFALLFLLQGVIRARPQGLVAQRLYPWFYAGLHLDELFTRATFRFWPARLAPEPTTAIVRSHLPTTIPGVL
ncbi:NADH-quinone oxidoreductase subunit L [Candidatus Contendibacter odensensis]|uniref:Probable inorganic carbon transporter subunit DabB n=1 Tax=Candidatus Contendobacter odensis Run_B_J11 TaxID=1400861 RepID=A0A7U7J306_9GAMM|nr:NADH-quinone oxidoreductase subunit L [Candidatus Contendobacter odensis]CDH43719.1 putative NADH dehydrogenase (Quinone) [Candidatus Contendobacter odensis Run_B_J11]